MKMVLIQVCVSVLVFITGCICYDIHTRNQPLIMVDVNRIIRLTAEGFAKEKLNEDQLQRRVMNFKQDLEESLSEFAVQQRVLILPSHHVYGKALDMTESFIAYHNHAGTVPNETSGERKTQKVGEHHDARG